MDKNKIDKPKSQKATFIQKIFLKLFLIIFKLFIKSEGKEDLLLCSKPKIFALNHNSTFETFFINLYLTEKRKGKKVSFIVDWMYGKFPILGWFLKQIDPIYVYNKPAKIKILNKNKNYINKPDTFFKIIEKLKTGKSIGIFPEGKRNKNYQKLSKGKPGLGKIIITSKVHVIPIGIDFPVRIKKQKIPKFGKIIFRVGEEMTFENEIKENQNLRNRKNLTKNQKKQIDIYFYKLVTHKVMKEISKLSGKVYNYNIPQPPDFLKINKIKEVLLCQK